LYWTRLGLVSNLEIGIIKNKDIELKLKGKKIKKVDLNQIKQLGKN